MYKDYIALYCSYMDLLYEKGNERMKNIVDVTILASLSAKSTINGLIAVFLEHIGKKT